MGRFFRKRKNVLGNQKGQTSVEYILLIAVVAVLANTIGRMVINRFVGPDRTCESNTKSMYCMAIGLYKRKSFTYFSITK